MITLALVGEVMLGRGANDALRTLRPEQPWGDVLPLLIAADLRIVNLECAITDHKQPWPRTPKVFHFRADPPAAEAPKAARAAAPPPPPTAADTPARGLSPPCRSLCSRSPQSGPRRRLLPGQQPHA